ncbi:MFS transporter [Oceanobacter antarcticus]|uniref:MFS transporter n=1 Tax=Oceanobacter antarcticus TaxID=3133425 RepID=A0ABW8NM33_9GAMM|tara:strand:+ start:636 stop:1853 length:1218 start_codon:yes stop_codon:yes gene_type:complete
MNKNMAPVARPYHAWLLLLCGCMSVLASVVIAPVLPQMQEYFSDQPNVGFMVPMALTAPGLVIALLSMAIGVLADKAGRKRLLVIGLVLYAIFGVAPVMIDSLPIIIATRIGVGFAEAILMTCSVALIGDYFDGVRRERYLALNTTFSSVSAVLFIAIGGALGEFGWRVPFFVYGISIFLAVAALFMLWEPKHHEDEMAAVDVSDEEKAKWNPWKIAGICSVTFVGAILFMSIQVHIGYLLGGVGLSSPSQIGLVASSGQIAVVLGSLFFGFLLGKAGFVTSIRLAMAFTLIAVGYLLVGFSGANVNLMVSGVLCAGFGGGLLLPTLMVWNMSNLPKHRRALGTGAWMAGFFLGQFFTPIVVVGLQSVLGTHADAIGMMGQVLLPIGIVLMIGSKLHKSARLSVA